MATARIPLQGPFSDRPWGIDKDWRFVNCYFEENQERPSTIKRPGTSMALEDSGDPRGITRFLDKLFYVVDDKLKSDDEDDDEFTLETSSDPVYFDDWFNKRMVAFDRDYLYIIDDSLEMTTIESDGSSDTDTLPPDLVHGVVILAGHVFVMDQSGAIYNSYYNEFDYWDDADFITADNVTDRGIRLARFKNYIFAFCTESIQVFYYTGQEPPGSPLKEIEQGFNLLGTNSPHSIVEFMDTLMFVGVNQNGNYGVYAMNGFTPERVSNPTIERYLENEGIDVTEIKSYPVFVEGHQFYCMNLPDQDTTLVYDMENNTWAEWKTNDSQFQLVNSTFYNNQVIGQGHDGNLYYVDPTVVTDNGDSFEMLVQTQRIDNDSPRDKFFSRLELYGDIQDEDAPVTIDWTDDDFQTWSNEREVNLNKHPIIHRLGKAKKRAFRVSSSADVKHRWHYLDLRIREGGYSGGTT